MNSAAHWSQAPCALPLPLPPPLIAQRLRHTHTHTQTHTCIACSYLQALNAEERCLGVIATAPLLPNLTFTICRLCYKRIVCLRNVDLLSQGGPLGNFIHGTPTGQKLRLKQTNYSRKDLAKSSFCLKLQHKTYSQWWNIVLFVLSSKFKLIDSKDTHFFFSLLQQFSLESRAIVPDKAFVLLVAMFFLTIGAI